MRSGFITLLYYSYYDPNGTHLLKNILTVTRHKQVMFSPTIFVDD